MAPTKDSDTGGKTNNKCGKCKKVVAKKDRSLKCEYCGLWHHATCENMSEQQYDFIMTQGNQLHWFCKACNSKAIEVLKLVQGIKDRQDDLDTKFTELSKQVDDMAEVKGQYGDKVRQVAREEYYEAKQREERIANIVIRNAKEIENELGQDRDEDETDDDEDEHNAWTTVRIVENIVQTVLGHADVKVVSAKRVPDKKTPGKNRAIVATLGNRNMKDKVLRVAKQLRDKQGWRDVYIGPDHTKVERERDYHLRVELKMRRDNGEADLVIRKGKIVNREDKDTMGDNKEANPPKGELAAARAATQES